MFIVTVAPEHSAKLRMSGMKTTLIPRKLAAVGADTRTMPLLRSLAECVTRLPIDMALLTELFRLLPTLRVRDPFEGQKLAPAFECSMETVTDSAVAPPDKIPGLRSRWCGRKPLGCSLPCSCRADSTRLDPPTAGPRTS